MVRNRIVYGVLILLASILCYHYPNTTTSMFAYALLALPVASLIYTLYIHSKFTYTQEIDKKFITKGETINFSFSIHNETSWYYPDIEIQFYGTDSIMTQYFSSRRMSIAADDKDSTTYEIECKYRGYYEIGVKKIYIRDFLGLYRLSYKIVEPKMVTVYPRIIVLKHFPLIECEGIESDLDRERAIGEGNLFSTIREYNYGDSMRQIHWKISAKKQTLMAKNNQSASPSMTYIFLDLGKLGYDLETNAIIEDKLIECTVAVLYYCLQKSMPIQFIYHLGEVVRRSEREMAAFDNLYKELFQIKFEAEASLWGLLELSGRNQRERGNDILITSALTTALYKQIERMTYEGRHIVLIYTSPRVVSDEQSEKDNAILKALSKLRVSCIPIAFEDDLKKVLER